MDSEHSLPAHCVIATIAIHTDTPSGVPTFSRTGSGNTREEAIESAAKMIRTGFRPLDGHNVIVTMTVEAGSRKLQGRGEEATADAAISAARRDLLSVAGSHLPGENHLSA